MTSKLKVIIAEDHPIFRDGLYSLVSAFDEIGQLVVTADGEEFLARIHAEDFDLALVDIKMPGIDGIEVITEARKFNPNMKFIVISGYESTDYINRALAAGTSAYLLKNSELDEIKDAILKVINGENYFSPGILRKITDEFGEKTSLLSFASSIPNLTDREIEILTFICQGLNRKDIARSLYISERTVDKHKENIQLKTNTTNSVSLVLYAIKNKLVELVQ